MATKKPAVDKAPAQQDAEALALKDGAADSVLGAAASTAQAGQQPEIEPQPPELKVTQHDTLRFGIPDAALAIHPAVRDLAVARALPLLTPEDGEATFVPSADGAITAFKDTDGTTMMVVRTVTGLAKTPHEVGHE